MRRTRGDRVISAAELLAQLESVDIRLSAAGERLRINAPRGKLTAFLREQIARHKDDILLLLRERAASSPGIFSAHCPILEGYPAPLSFAQERLWFLEQLEPGRSVYNLCRAVRITGALNVPALAQGFNAVMERHQALRTKFLPTDGRPVQVVVAAEAISLVPMDLRRLSAEARETEARRLLVAEANRPFDLTQGRLLRALLLRQGDAAYLLAMTMHHIVADAWSMGILTRELWTFYRAFDNGGTPALPDLPIQYCDHAARQRRLLQGELLETALGYWRKQLAEIPVLDLPADLPRPPRQSQRGARHKIELPASLTAALNELCRCEGVTLFMTLLAVYQVLLHRYSKQVDIAVGSPVANRDSTEVEGLIGFFVNTLVLRADLSGEPSFREFLQRVREVCLDAYAHKDIPFEKLVSELNPRRALDRNPLFQAMFVLQNTPYESPTVSGLVFAPIEIDNPTAQFDLSLYLRERAGRLIGFFEYATALFDRKTIERMAGHFQVLLESAVADPECSIAALPMLIESERRRILFGWNDTAADYPRDVCIHQLFEAQVDRTPLSAALEFEGACLTYRELNRRANGLARSLRKLGVGAESLVAVLLDRSFDMVATLLAVLKAGGAYVPLDPAYPRDRLAYMLGDARVGVVLTQAKYASLVADGPATVVCVEDLFPGNRAGDVNLSCETTADNAAYVIYTSGSTGTPKGAVGLHRGAVNRLSWMGQAYPFAPGEVICHKTSLSFVDSVWEIFGGLLKGIPTVIVPEAVAKEPEHLVRHLSERKVTRLVAVPSLLKAILDLCPKAAEQLKDLKYCVSSGEALLAALAGRFRAALPGCRLLNLYGSSEVAGDVACYEVRDDPGATVPIGRPIQNTQIFLLDRYQEPVPIGVRGEIYIGGDNLARGYLNRPELTQEKFVVNPFAGENTRLYRTGDLARYRADGNIEFLGRADGQLKVRGCRVESGEIEAALCRHPGVRECVVDTNELHRPAPPSQPSPVEGEGVSDSDAELIAYVVAGREEPSAAELREFLRRTLPDFMIPARFEFIDKIPLLPSGKVDRASLAALPRTAVEHKPEQGDARTETEALVAQIWRQVLNTERVGADDNFFALGGHSLLAAEVVAKIRAASGRDVTIAELFESPTAAGLARIIEKKLDGDAATVLPPIVASPRRRFIPLSPGQQRLFVFSQLLGGDFLNMPYGYRLHGPLNVDALRAAITEIVRRHAVLRTGFLDAGDGPRQRFRSNVAIRVPLVDLSSLDPERQAERVESLSHQDVARCFDLEKPPLLRVHLLRLADDKHLLLVTMHHLVTDQWSMGVFRKELVLIYDAVSKGAPSPLPDLSFQFIDYVLWQRRLIAQGSFAGSLDYWQRQLGGPPPRLDFHGTRRPRKTPRYQSTRKPFDLDGGLFAGIKRFAAEENYTPFMVFLGGLFSWLYRLTDSGDIRIATLVANRSRPGTERLIGYFVNAVVLRAQVSPTMTLRELLKAVREICLSAYAHAELPYEYLEEFMEGAHGRRNGAAFQVMLNYRTLSAPVNEANGLTIAPWQGKNRAGQSGIDISRLDVNVHLREVSTELTGAVNFRSDRFDDCGMARFLTGYAHALHQLIASPGRLIGQIPRID